MTEKIMIKPCPIGFPFAEKISEVAPIREAAKVRRLDSSKMK